MRRSLALVVAVGLASTPLTRVVHAKPTPTRTAGTVFRIGLAHAEELVRSEDEDDQLRGLTRLGAIGTPRALFLLSRLVAAEVPGGARGRLTAVRALAPHASDPVAQRALVRLMTAEGSADAADRLGPWTRASAALALARADSPGAWQALRQAVDADGPLGDFAAAAVLAHPPRDVLAFLGDRPIESARLATTLGALGDQRAFTPLRAAIIAGAPEVRASAALALTRLGAFETVELARYWLATDAAAPLRAAAVEILALARAEDAPTAIAALVEDPTTRRQGLALARDFARGEVVPALERALTSVSSEDREAVFAALGASGEPRAVRTLVAGLDRAADAPLAAYALAWCPGAAADPALERALATPSTRRQAARAAVLRATALDLRRRELVPTLERMVRAAEPADRAAGAWGLAVLDEARGRELLGSEDPVVVAAAARAALTPELATVAARRLEQESNGPLRSALAMTLATATGRAQVSNRTLAALVAGGGAAAPLAARALAARAGQDAQSRTDEALASGNVAVRAHAAMGLGDARRPAAIGQLERAYRFEPDPRVRRAIVIALGRREETARRRPLALAAALDADVDVRAAARTALANQAASLDPGGRGTLWVTVQRPDGTAVGGAEVAVQLPTGLELPALADPDGIVTLAHLPPGAVTLRLADVPGSDNPRSRDDRQGAPVQVAGSEP